jgi:hypothetical protein
MAEERILSAWCYQQVASAAFLGFLVKQQAPYPLRLIRLHSLTEERGITTHGEGL